MQKRLSTKDMLKILYTICVLCAIQKASCVSVRVKEKQILENIFATDKYDSRLRPPTANGSTDDSTTVRVNFFVRSISSIDDVKMQYNVQLTFRQQWQDERLKYYDDSGLVRYLTLTDAKLPWVPDLFFSNEIKGHFHDMMVPNLYFRIFPDGTVLYSRRLSLTLSCPMNLRSYPLDEQLCSIRIASYGYTTEDISLVWKESDPVQVVRNLHLPNFSLQSFLTDLCTSKTSTGTYDCLKVDFLFKRHIFYYILQVYIPTCMMVIISWASFWYDPTAVTARLMLSFLTLLVLALLTSTVTASLPPGSYPKSINIWTGVCLTFVFAAFLEFVVVNYLSRRDNRKLMREQLDSTASDGDAFLMKPLGKNETKCTLRHHFKRLNCFETWSKRFKTRAKCIDVASRIFFPALFVLFNLIYWVPYAAQ